MYLFTASFFFVAKLLCLLDIIEIKKHSLSRMVTIVFGFSVIFAGFGFLAFYIAGKLQTFSLEKKGQSFRLIAFLLPLVAALAVALTRVRDHWHHWEGKQ